VRKSRVLVDIPRNVQTSGLAGAPVQSGSGPPRPDA